MNQKATKRATHAAMQAPNLEWAAQYHGDLCRRLGTRCDRAAVRPNGGEWIVWDGEKP